MPAASGLQVITGGTGFIGRHLTELLSARGDAVRIVSRNTGVRPAPAGVEELRADLSRPEECRRACAGAHTVIHAAGLVGAAGVGPLATMQNLTTNLVLTAQMLQAAWEAGAKRFLLFGSSTAYPAADHPVTEEELWAGPPHPAYFGYGWMRRYLERLGEFVASKSDLRVVVVRPSAVYGPGDRFDAASGHVIPSLIRRAVERENPFVVWGDGSEVRDFLHVRDFARGCVLALDRLSGGGAINIAAGRGVTIRELVALVLRAAGHAGAQVVFDPTKPTAIPRRTVDIGKAERLLGFRPEIGLEEGLRETVAWYVAAAGR
ncbi:MAG: NAD-dependent epimerase/dehydratase family protein [Planctomycetes bacterium]|nr:NAD-dependent epimerase/dehydratase family protein [Planctomycetota bacterium]